MNKVNIDFLKDIKGYIIYDPSNREFSAGSLFSWSKTPKIWSRLSTIKGMLTNLSRMAWISFDSVPKGIIVIDLSTQQQVLDVHEFLLEAQEKHQINKALSNAKRQ